MFYITACDPKLGFEIYFEIYLLSGPLRSRFILDITVAEVKKHPFTASYDGEQMYPTLQKRATLVTSLLNREYNRMVIKF